MEVNQGQLLKLISVIKKSVEVNHSMKLIRTPNDYNATIWHYQYANVYNVSQEEFTDSFSLFKLAVKSNI